MRENHLLKTFQESLLYIDYEGMSICIYVTIGVCSKQDCSYK